MRNGKFDKHEEAFSEKTEPDDIAFQATVDATLLLNVFRSYFCFYPHKLTVTPAQCIMADCDVISDNLISVTLNPQCAQNK